MERVLILYHDAAREYLFAMMNAEAIHEKDKTAKTCIMTYGDLNFWERVIDFFPTIVYTFPIKSLYDIEMMIDFKTIFGAKIFCGTTEGVYDLDNTEMVDVYSGKYNYPSKLVDAFIFWGNKPAKVIGSALLRKKKISSIERIKVTGYPGYDQRINNVRLDEFTEIINDYEKKQELYKKVVLCVTGFNLANYNYELLEKEQCGFDWKNAGKKEKEIYWQKRKKEIEENQRYREEYIERIVEAANTNKDILFIVKMHPVEISLLKSGQGYSYSELNNIENVFLVKKSIPLYRLIKNVNLFFHYGSTTALEAYINGIPTIHLYNSNSTNSLKEQILFESTVLANVCEKGIVNKIINESPHFSENKKIDEYLYKMMNYSLPYSPCSWNADILLSKIEMQELNREDVFVKKALQGKEADVIRRILLKNIYLSVITKEIPKDTKKYISLYKKTYYGFLHFFADVLWTIRHILGKKIKRC